MLKLLGICCILGGTTGLGLTFAWELQERSRELLELRKLLLLLRGDIRYMHQPLPEAFLHLSRNTGPPFTDFFLQVSKDLNGRKGKTAEELWQQNLKLCMGRLHISRQEREAFGKLGGMLGCMDVESQLHILDYYLELLEQFLKDASDSEKNKRRLYQYLGILSGAAMAVLII